MKGLATYYTDNVVSNIFNSVSNPQWRVWKVEDITGVVRQNRTKINSVNKLKKFIGLKASKVYVSVAKFLNPERCFGLRPKRSQWIYDDSIFLGSDLLFDLDCEEDRTIAWRDARKLIKHMKKNKDYELSKITFSGNKGFHVIYKDLNPISEPDPLKRLQLTKQRRESVVKSLPNLRTIDNHHKSIICDQFRVRAAEHTLKAKTGYKVLSISESDFMLKSYNILKGIYLKRSVRPISSRPSSEKTGPMIGGSTHPTYIRAEERAGLSSYPLFYYFVTQKVKGTAGANITILKYPKNKNATSIVKRIQEVYKLNQFYKVDCGTYNVYLNLSLVDNRRLEKIMRFAKPMNLGSHSFFKHDWMQFTPKITENGEEITEQPYLEDIIPSVFGLNKHISRPHYNLLFLKEQFNYLPRNLAGAEHNKVAQAIITRTGEMI